MLIFICGISSKWDFSLFYIEKTRWHWVKICSNEVLILRNAFWSLSNIKNKTIEIMILQLYIKGSNDTKSEILKYVIVFQAFSIHATTCREFFFNLRIRFSKISNFIYLLVAWQFVAIIRTKQKFVLRDFL